MVSLRRAHATPEYGISPDQKLRIGAKICSTLLGKILRDFAAVREEAAAAWRAALLPRTTSLVGSRTSIPHAAHDAAHPEGGGGSGSDTDEDDGGFRLHAQYADDINSKSRHVRTRVYFTSESHMHALVNVIRYAHLSEAAAPGAGPGTPLVSAEGEAALGRTRELDYGCTVVFRMFELKDLPPADPAKFRMELLFSPGAAGDPFAAAEPSHALPVAPRVPLWEHAPPEEDGAGGGRGGALTLNRMEAALGAFAAGWRAKGCPELGGGSSQHQRTPSGGAALSPPAGPRDSA
jgi:inositol hexakisphosphate/diphosphoinositol-pentakisphosphate kinase